MMKKVIFTLLLGLSLAQVSPVAAAGNSILKDKHLRGALYVGIAAAVALCGVEAVSYNKCAKPTCYKVHTAIPEQKEHRMVKVGEIIPEYKLKHFAPKEICENCSEVGRLENSLNVANLLSAAKFLAGGWAFASAEEGAAPAADWADKLKNFGKLAGVVIIDAAVITALVALGDVIIRSDKALAVTLLKKCFGSKKTAKVAAPVKV